MTEEKITMKLETETCPDCNYDLSPFDAYQGTCPHCENKK